MLRTHNCGELTEKNTGEEIKLCGWVASRRDHGEIIFMDLRDKHGITQIVFDPEKNKAAHEKAHQLRNEYCLKITGKVDLRPDGTINEKIKTGKVEVEVTEIDILSESDTPPFEVKDDIEVSEDVRLKYRYLDIRRSGMQKKLKIRHKINQFITNFLDEEGFISVETPMLTKSTPEGARDYLVPSRVQQGSFYALPQSPQIFKQLLMVGGLEKYFQIVRCFRDEDLRADRQPEFTQLDMEMSFVEQDDVLGVCERLFKGLFENIMKIKVDLPFPKIKYAEAITKYGSDKPDTRFEIFLNDITEEAKGSEFKVFNSVIDSGGKIVAIAAPGYAGISRKDIDLLTSYAGEYGAKGLAYFKVEEEGLVSPTAKFFSKETLDSFKSKTGAKVGDMIFIVADASDVAYEALGAVRLKIGRDSGLIDEKKFNFLWVVDFPLFKFNKEDNRWVSEHHPFTSFRDEDVEAMDKGDYGKVVSKSYDLVLNGSEIGSGSIRIHNKDIQQKIFNALGLTEEESNKKFGFLLDAFKYGPPPHGGVAFGLDRIITLFTKDQSIREVIAFPKTQKGVCPLTNAPSTVSDEQLRESGLKLLKKKEDKE